MTTPTDVRPAPPRPPAPDKRPAISLTPAGLRAVRDGHPWVFDGSITKLRPANAAETGALGVVFDDKRRFAAIGLYDPDSPIALRVLHAGAPRQIDGAFWAELASRAVERRTPLVEDDDTDGYRVLHGENDGVGGLVVDRYGDTLVTKIYTAAWLPHLDSVLAPLVERLGTRRIVVRASRHAAERISPPMPWILAGTPPDGPVPFVEHGLRFAADVVDGQKTGHFLDQRQNRRLVGTIAEDASVLDVFCCTGGFSVHSAAGGARSVTSVDLSPHAIRDTVDNLARNPEVGPVAHEPLIGDAFDVLAELAAHGRRFDVVVVDPPSFAPRADRVESARRAYARLTRLALDVLAPGGMLVQSSCSSRVTSQEFHRGVLDAAAEHGVRLREWARTGHAVDHPIGFPEGAYLKTMFARRS